MRNKAISILVSVALAFVFWLYVVTVVSPESSETYYNIPVALQNESILSERGLMITSEDPFVDLRLHGNRTDLIELNSSNITVIANVASIETPGTHKVNYEVTYPGNVASNAVSVTSRNPGLVELKVENRIKKSIPVVLDYGDTKVPDGLIADKANATLDVDKIEISGPQSVVDKITRALIEIDLTNQTKTLVGQFDYLLCDDSNTPIDAKWITTNAEAINVTLKIQQVKELQLDVDPIPGGGATRDNCLIKIEPETIQVAGSEMQLADLDKLILGTINLADIEDGQELIFPITLPDGVDNQTGLQEAKVTVKFPNMVVKELQVTKIQTANKPADIRANVVSRAVNVKVRGPKDLIEGISARDITVLVDLAEAKEGRTTMKAQLVFADAYKACGLVGPCNVTVEIERIKK